MPRLLQITDTHLVTPPGLVSGRLDTAALLAETVEHIATVLPMVAPVDALLVTGDLSDDGSAESYAIFRRLIEPLGLPILPIPGNHDLREPMRTAFGDLNLFPQKGRLNWATRIDPLKIVGIDTLIEGAGGGIVDEETLDFLESELAQDGPVLLAMHHPPFLSGIRFMDGIGLSGIDRLSRVLSSSNADIRIACGHLHLVATGSVGRVPAIVGPSSCSTFQNDFRPQAPVGFFTGGGGFMVHDWSDGFRSINIPPAMGEGVFAF